MPGPDSIRCCWPAIRVPASPACRSGPSCSAARSWWNPRPERERGWRLASHCWRRALIPAVVVQPPGGDDAAGRLGTARHGRSDAQGQADHEIIVAVLGIDEKAQGVVGVDGVAAGLDLSPEFAPF